MSIAPDHFDADANGPDPVIPARLGESLRSQLRPVDFRGLSGLDEVVLAAAARSFARRRSMLLVIRTGTGLAAAAAVTLAVWGGWAAFRRGSASLPLPAGLASSTRSFDQPRHVTIIDAFMLARLLENRKPGDPPLPSTWDVNHDGRIDQQDIDLLAQKAVKLSSAATPAHGGTGGGT